MFIIVIIVTELSLIQELSSFVSHLESKPLKIESSVKASDTYDNKPSSSESVPKTFEMNS